MKEHKTYDIYYDEEGDFLEITFGEPSKSDYAEEIEPGIFITKDEENNEIKGVSVLSFKKRPGILNSILERVHVALPIEIRSTN